MPRNSETLLNLADSAEPAGQIPDTGTSGVGSTIEQPLPALDGTGLSLVVLRLGVADTPTSRRLPPSPSSQLLP